MIHIPQTNIQKLTLVTTAQKELRPLIKAAIDNELRIMQAGIRRTQQRIANFEAQYGMKTEEFLHRYRNDGITETLETIEWFGEWELLERLREDETILQGVDFAEGVANDDTIKSVWRTLD